jgi:lipopolysaccharide heptosyltransferase I
MKLLVVKLSAFGDIIHALPAMHDLLQRPQVEEVHWLLDSRYRFVAGAFPPGVTVHCIDLKGEKPLREIRRVRRELRQLAPDLVLDMQGLIKSGFLARLAGAPVLGMDPEHMRERMNRLFVRSIRFHPEERHVVQQYRRIAAAPFYTEGGIPQHPMPYQAPYVAFDAGMKQAGDEQLDAWGLTPGRYVWLHLGGGWATKQLPQPSWEWLAGALAADGLTPVLGWGNPAEQRLAEQVKGRVGSCILPEQRLDMPALCGVLARAAAVVGADTGVVHLAAALGAPTVSFWGPSAAWRSAPLGPKDRHVQSNPPCGPCFKRECDNFICMDMIRPDDILAAIHEFSPIH